MSVTVASNRYVNDLKEEEATKEIARKAFLAGSRYTYDHIHRLCDVAEDEDSMVEYLDCVNDEISELCLKHNVSPVL